MALDQEITLEGSIATWTLPPTNSDIGGTYTGSFQFRCWIDPVSQLQAGREFREFLGAHSNNAPFVEGELAFGLVQLKHRVVKSPPFWSSTLQESGMAGNIGDLKIISMVLNAAMRSEALFKEKVQKERDLVLDKSIKTAEKLLQEEKE